MAVSRKQISSLDFDKILEHVGPLGLWQFWHLLMLFFVGLISGIAATTFAFTGKILCILEYRDKIIAMAIALMEFQVQDTKLVRPQNKCVQ